MKRTISILLLLLGIALFSQQITAQEDLLKRANENYLLLSTNPEKAFLEAKDIESEAKSINAKEAELVAIRNQCNYYKINNDFKNIITTSKLLFSKASKYALPSYQVIAKTYLSDGYLYSNLLVMAQDILEIVYFFRRTTNSS